MKKYWEYSNEHDIHLDDDSDCRNNFWTSNKPINNTHLRIVELHEFSLRGHIRVRLPVFNDESGKLSGLYKWR